MSGSLGRRTLLVSALTAPLTRHALAGATVPPPSSAQAPSQPRQPLLVPGKQTLFQRIITRPGAALAPRADGTGGLPIPGFAVYYVYSREDGAAGSVEVGRSIDGHVEGWIPASKTIDWKHAMIGAFTNPAGRQPVLFLNSALAEQRLLLDPHAGETARHLQAEAAANRPGNVVAVEPSTFVNIAERFYLLPILSARTIEREFGPPVRLLEVISAPAEPQPPQPPSAYKASLVFLVDTTISMQPYIELTRDMIRRTVTNIGASALRDDFRFGLVAYRDSLEDTPDLEYSARVYAKPDFSKPPEAVVSAIAQVQEARASSNGFDEDAIGGLNMAIDQIDWNAVAGRHIVLITDSGARPAIHPHSVTHLGITEIKEKAKALGIAVWVVHLRTPAGASRHDHAPAQAQYQELAAFNGTDPLYFPVADGAPQQFSDTIDALTRALLVNAANAAGQAPPAMAPGPIRAAPSQVSEQVRVVGEAMRLAYLGRVDNVTAPDVVRSWTTDQDLTDPTVESLGVRVLLTRNQLSDLAHALERVLQAGLADRTAPQTFFNQLRATFAQAATDPQRIAQATRIGNLLGEYLDDLPYRSELMSLSEDDWLAMGAVAQRQILNNVESRLQLYRDFDAHPDLWIDLAHSHNPGEAVYPVPIEALP